MARMFNPPRLGPSSNKMKAAGKEQKQETSKKTAKSRQKPKQDRDT